MVRLAVFLLALRALAQAPLYICPMDPEVRSTAPGKCPRCGMTLVAFAPEPEEYPMEFEAEPARIPANRDVLFRFRVLDPHTNAPVTDFSIVHEKLFHLFLVSQDLEYFSHEHPTLGSDGWFRLHTRLPKAGTYRLLADFDPLNGTPQYSARTFSTEGFVAPLETSIPLLQPDVSTKQGRNLSVELTTDPATPIAGKKTMLFVTVHPAEGLEQFIGAWAHLLAVSDDSIDMIHTHPVYADGGAKMQFNLFFPRARNYRLWIQTQRKGVVNTVAFTVPVGSL